MGFVLKGAALFRASTLLAAIGFLLFGYDQVCHLYNDIWRILLTYSFCIGCHVWCRSQ